MGNSCQITPVQRELWVPRPNRRSNEFHEVIKYELGHLHVTIRERLGRVCYPHWKCLEEPFVVETEIPLLVEQLLKTFDGVAIVQCNGQHDFVERHFKNCGEYWDLHKTCEFERVPVQEGFPRYFKFRRYGTRPLLFTIDFQGKGFDDKGGSVMVVEEEKHVPTLSECLDALENVLAVDHPNKLLEVKNKQHVYEQEFYRHAPFKERKKYQNGIKDDSSHHPIPRAFDLCSVIFNQGYNELAHNLFDKLAPLYSKQDTRTQAIAQLLAWNMDRRIRSKSKIPSKELSCAVYDVIHALCIFYDTTE